MVRGVRRRHSILAVSCFAAATAASRPALADFYSLSISNNMALGQVQTAPSGVTTFRVDPQSGQISQVSGSGQRLSNSLARVMFGITCDPSGDDNGKGNGGIDFGSKKQACTNDKLTVTIGAVGQPTGRAQPLKNFTVSMSSASLASPPVGAGPITFTLNPVGAGQTATFYLGADFPVAGDDSNLPTGAGQSSYYVLVTDVATGQFGNEQGVATLTAIRALSISKTSDLQFGIVAQARTAGTVTVDPNTGQRTVTGGSYGYPSPAWGPASFTITGEGGQAFSVFVPGNVQLSGPTNLNVTPTTNLPDSPVLSNSSGNAGTFVLKVGGSFPISSGSMIGTYSGVWSITVSYN